jgi:hypothetical protein
MCAGVQERPAARIFLSVLRIFGVSITADEARSLVASLVGTGRPAALSAAARITSTLERGSGLVALEPQQRDAILHVLEAPRSEGLVELRTRLGEDAAKRHGVV